jgi:hypothetical protein
MSPVCTPPPSLTKAKTLVLGCGGPDVSAVVEELSHGLFKQPIDFIDVGPMGLEALPHLASHRRLLAIGPLPPDTDEGTLLRGSAYDLERLIPDARLHEFLALASLHGKAPRDFVIIAGDERVAMRNAALRQLHAWHLCD